ncbi:MAG: DNA polymerase III subunit alpha [Peptostreptococcaceae bacterium]|nr:DNA polymerase III subunit alpha [Peptostreptococcaceae bacterium]
MFNRFTELHVHSEYSMRDGANKVEKLIDRAIELGHKAIAITDHGTMAGIIPAYIYAKEKNFKIIVGCEFYVGREERNHLVVLAKNEKGYKNMLKLVALSNKPEHFYYKPTIEEADLFANSEGLIVLTACIGGKHGRLIINGEKENAYNSLMMYKNIFKDDLYVEIQHNSIPVQESVNRELIDLARKLGIKIVATNDVHFLTKEDAYAHEVLLAMQQQKKMNDEKRWKFDGDTYYIHLYEEMLKLPLPLEAIHNTQEIVDKCNVEIDLSSIHAPSYCPTKEEEVALIKTKMNKWYAKKFGNTYNKEVIDRINSELKVIIEKDFTGYFLLVADYINAFESMEIEQYGIKQNLMCGAGRGSGVGSLVAYALGITKVNPLEYDLLFERFINVDRLSYPDIDTDFDYEHRQKGIQYMIDKYGSEHVAQISAFGTLQPKATFRSILSAFDYPTNIINKISKLIPEGCEKIEDALRDPALMFATKGMEKEIEVMKALEGITTTQSMHPAGVVVTDEPIYTYAPCHTASDDRNKYVISLDKKKVEKVGLIKHDFLGLKTVTILRKTLARIKKTYGVDIDIWNLPKDDKKVYSLLNSGHLTGVFQLDGDSAKAVVEKLKPSKFDDIIACEAVCRPGVKEAKDYIEKMCHSYGIEEVDKILEPTYGAIVFQEQTMRLMNVVAGWTLGKADYMRKVKDLEEYRADFVSCAMDNGYDSNFANNIFDRFDLGYSFNKSHAVAYAFITYATAYLKAYYPAEYMCEFIDMYKDDRDTVNVAIAECKALGINITAPNINATHVGFDVVDGNICFGLSGVKGVGEKAVEKLIAYTKNTKITTLQELIDSNTLNKTGILAMIKCGVFDKEGERVDLINSYIATRSKKERETEMITEYNEKMKLAWEKDVCGIYLTSHPLDKFLVKNYSEVSNFGVIGGIINSVKVIKTKNGKEMCFLQLEDRETIIDVTVFPNVYTACKHNLVEGNIVFTKGRKDGNNKWLSDNIERLGCV